MLWSYNRLIKVAIKIIINKEINNEKKYAISLKKQIKTPRVINVLCQTIDDEKEEFKNVIKDNR